MCHASTFGSLLLTYSRLLLYIIDTMNIHILQHAAFEGPACISDWCSKAQLSLTRTHLYQGDPLPDIKALDILVVLGGPMSVTDKEHYPWLNDELSFIRQCIAEDKTVLGICLGAQLVATSLGARVTPNQDKEIGWFALQRDAALADHPLARILPENFDAFHWHGETFALPEGAVPLASSAACANQGFVYKDKVLGLQFHLETSFGLANLLIKNCHYDLAEGPYTQTETEMLSKPERFDQAQRRMYQLLDYVLNQTRLQ